MSDLALRLLLGFLPVVLFFLALMSLDSFKLVRLRAALATIAAGAAAALIAMLLNNFFADVLGLHGQAYSRYGAPLVEEALKALPVLFLIRSQHVGFLVDSAIYGFAAGAGFALAENVYYLASFPETGPVVWVIRGFGTAILHPADGVRAAGGDTAGDRVRPGLGSGDDPRYAAVLGRAAARGPLHVLSHDPRTPD